MQNFLAPRPLPPPPAAPHPGDAVVGSGKHLLKLPRYSDADLLRTTH